MAYEGARVRSGVLIRGYVEAAERFQTAAGGRDPDAAFFALFEALNWAVAVDDLLGEVWRPAGTREGYDWRARVPNAEVMDGVRYARNLVHHHWADAVGLEDRGATFPLRFPVRFFFWLWRAADELPPPTRRWDKARRSAYESQLAGRNAEDTLASLAGVFSFVGRLDPPRATPVG
jgi:hypothetical protein